MRVTRDQIVTLMQVLWCNDTARYRPIWEHACANLIFKCVMLPSQKLGSNHDVLRLVMSFCLFLPLSYNMESLSRDPVSLEATSVGSNFRSPQRCRHETAIYNAVCPMHAACKMIIAMVLKRTYNVVSLLKCAPMLSMSCGSPPLEPEDSRFVLPGKSPESRELMHAVVIQTAQEMVT